MKNKYVCMYAVVQELTFLALDMLHLLIGTIQDRSATSAGLYVKWKPHYGMSVQMENVLCTHCTSSAE